MKRTFYSLLSALILLFATDVNAQYCTTTLYQTACVDDDYIESFSTTGGTTNITNPFTGCGNFTTGYTYYSAQTHTGIQGSTVNFKIVNTPIYDEYYKIFVDWNGDTDFLDAGEIVYTGFILEMDSVMSSFTIPVSATPGTKRLRVRCVYDPTPFTACSLEDYGEIEDYNLVVVAATPCSGTPVAGTASSAVSSICAGVPFNIALTGTTAASGLTIQWQSRPVGGSAWNNIAGATASTLSVANQTTATEYRATVSCGVNNANSNIVTISQSSFTTCYCNPTNGSPFATISPENDILNVTIAGTTLNYSTATVPANGYTQVPSTGSGTATLIAGSTYNFIASIDTWTADAAAWIDYNHDGIFSTTERITLTINSSVTSATGSFTVPATALSGQTGLRVMASEWNPITGPCQDMGIGEVEDYVITITGGTTACVAPAGLSASSVTSSTATLNWNTVAGAIGYEYVVNQSATPPAGSGTGITATTYNIPSLTASTTYYAHVRAHCGGTNYSPWATTSFTTTSATSCTAPVSVSFTGITSTSANASWGAVTGATGYEYVVNTSATAPTGAGTPITATTIALPSLTPSTNYYFHLRTICAGSVFSNWTTNPFNTSVTGINSVNASGLFMDVYPNPATQMVTVKLSDKRGNNATISLSDISGKQILAERVEAEEITIDIRNVPAGIYILKYNDSMYSQTVKLTKQ